MRRGAGHPLQPAGRAGPWWSGRSSHPWRRSPDGNSSVMQRDIWPKWPGPGCARRRRPRTGRRRVRDQSRSAVAKAIASARAGRQRRTTCPRRCGRGPRSGACPAFPPCSARSASRVVAVDAQLQPGLVEVLPVHDQAEALVCLQAFRVVTRCSRPGGLAAPVGTLRRTTNNAWSSWPLGKRSGGPRSGQPDRGPRCSRGT